jgi:hypothetical protein
LQLHQRQLTRCSTIPCCPCATPAGARAHLRNSSQGSASPQQRPLSRMSPGGFPAVSPPPLAESPNRLDQPARVVVEPDAGFLATGDDAWAEAPSDEVRDRDSRTRLSSPSDAESLNACRHHGVESGTRCTSGQLSEAAPANSPVCTVPMRCPPYPRTDLPKETAKTPAV